MGQSDFSPDAVGGLKLFSGPTIPADWMLCDGRALQRGSYPDLFALIGTTFGAGDGLCTFNIPDLRNDADRGSPVAYVRVEITSQGRSEP